MSSSEVLHLQNSALIHTYSVIYCYIEATESTKQILNVSVKRNWFLKREKKIVLSDDTGLHFGVFFGKWVHKANM